MEDGLNSLSNDSPGIIQIFLQLLLVEMCIRDSLMGVSSAAMAQATYTDSEENVYTFQKHWFLDLQGGAQYTLGEAKDVYKRQCLP